MISNTFKFKTGNRVGSNLVLSELIRSFELHHPVQRSLTPKWVLVCLHHQQSCLAMTSVVLSATDSLELELV